jgi:PAS domain S-box-containing protein
LDVLPHGLAVLDRRGVVVFANGALEKLLDAGPLAGLTVGQLGTRLHGLHLAGRFSRLLAAGEGSHLRNVPAGLPGGRSHSVNLSLVPFEDGTAALLVVQDNGPSAAEIESAAREQHFLAAAAAASDDAVFGLDPAGAIRAWNYGARRIFGFGDEEFRGRPLLSLLPDEAAGGRLKLEALSRSGSARNVQTHGLTKAGRRIPVLVTATPIRDGRQVTGASIVIKEIADVRALHEKSLEAARLKTILETVASVNHEINNPLAIVMGNLQLLLRNFEAGPPSIRAQLRSADLAGKRIAQVIRRLSNIVEPVETEYLKGRGIPMIDLRRSKAR